MRPSALLLPAVCLLPFVVPGCTGAGETGGGSDGTAADGARRFHFTYTATIPAPPAGTKQLRVWVPLPMQDPGVQAIANLQTSVNGDATLGRRTRETVFGNRMLYVELRAPSEPTTIRWSADVTRWPDLGQGALPRSPRYLQANRLIPLDGHASLAAARLKLRDGSRPMRTRVRGLYDDVLSGMEYDKTVAGYGLGDFQRAMTVCKGNCTDFHARFIGVGRAGGVPCRFTMGIPLKPVPSGTYNSYHCWAHWFDGRTWLPVDISEADKVAATDPEKADSFFGHLDPDRIALTFGRDVTLSPRQSAPPLNYFVFPHAEADSQPLSLDKSMWTFTYANLPSP